MESVEEKLKESDDITIKLKSVSLYIYNKYVVENVFFGHHYKYKK